LTDSSSKRSKGFSPENIIDNNYIIEKKSLWPPNFHLRKFNLPPPIRKLYFSSPSFKPSHFPRVVSQGFWLMWHHIRHASMVSRQLLGGKSDYVNSSGGQIDFIIKITKINFQNVCKCFFENLCNLKSLIRFNIKHPYKFCLAQKNWYQFYFCFIESCSILYMMHVLKLFELYTVSFLCLFGHRCSYFLLLSHFDVYSVIDALIIY
jgi:hypothetical protein